MRKFKILSKNIVLISLFITQTYSYAALPTLDTNQFFAPSSLFNKSEWVYTGTLPNALNAGFLAVNIDDDLFGNDRTYSTGNRSINTRAGTRPGYSFSFFGKFEGGGSQVWNSSLLDQSKGLKQSDDLDYVDQLAFPDPHETFFSHSDYSITNEHPIPENWQSLTGYANPAGSYAKFDQTFNLSKNFLEPGEYGCTVSGADTGCAFIGAYFNGGVKLMASMLGTGVMNNNNQAGIQSLDIDLKANRTTTFKVNNDTIYSGEIHGTADTFSLKEGENTPVDFEFTGSFDGEDIPLHAEIGFRPVQWEGTEGKSWFEDFYVDDVVMTEYEYVGLSNQYHIEVQDNPQLSLGITGADFDSAKAWAGIGINDISTTLVPVFQAVPASRLVVKQATIFGMNDELPIPTGGFDRKNATLYFLLENDGSIDLTLDHLDFSLVDKDDPLFPISDDLLRKINTDINRTIPPLSTLALAYNLTIPESNLNSAIDFLEGQFLEPTGSGVFSFHDIYGSRDRKFSATVSESATAPEPGIIFLLISGILCYVPVSNFRFFDPLRTMLQKNGQ